MPPMLPTWLMSLLQLEVLLLATSDDSTSKNEVSSGCVSNQSHSVGIWYVDSPAGTGTPANTRGNQHHQSLYRTLGGGFTTYVRNSKNLEPVSGIQLVVVRPSVREKMS